MKQRKNQNEDDDPDYQGSINQGKWKSDYQGSINQGKWKISERKQAAVRNLKRNRKSPKLKIGENLSKKTTKNEQRLLLEVSIWDYLISSEIRQGLSNNLKKR